MTSGLGRALVAAILLAVAAPPAPIPGAEWLVLAGLAGLYSVATASTRPYRAAYVCGLCYMLAFSWSLRHVSVGGYVAIGFVGALYYALVVAWARAFGRFRLLGFACGVAATHWLRAHMPEIYYPHGQPCHALYEWPWVLGPVRWGGEVLANALLAAVAAAAVDAYRSWRVARPEWRAANARLAVGVLLWLATCALALGGAPDRADRLRVGVVQPGLALAWGAPLRLSEIEARLVAPTLELAGPDVADPPELVLWPESCYPDSLLVTPSGERRQWPLRDPQPGGQRRPPFRLRLAADVRLCVGSDLREYRDDRDFDHYVTAMLVDEVGRVLDWHEKRYPVPAGERPPFVGLLPESWGDAIVAWGRDMIGQLPNVRPGRPRPPLRTAAGVPFAALTCYDNAFRRAIAEQVAQGARCIVVLSNEAWYDRGGELPQLVAMTVVRALESRTPVVRCTMNGWSVAIDRDGRLLAELPYREVAGETPQRAVWEIPLGRGAAPPMAWLHLLCEALVLATLLVVVGRRLRSWVRIGWRRSRPPQSESGDARSDRGGLDPAV